MRVRTVVAALAALGVVAAPPAVAAEGDGAAAAAHLEVVAGYDGLVVPGTWTPVTVRLSPEQPFAGRVIVASTSPNSGARSLQTREVEVGAGATKAFEFLVPPPGDLQVQIVSGDDGEPTTIRPRRQPPDGFLVGLLGDPATGQPPSVTSTITQARATYVTVDEDRLRLGASALEPLSAVVVPHRVLTALDDTSRSALVQATARGLQLVVTEPTGTDLGLPWQPATGLEDTALTPAPGAWGATGTELAGDGDAGAEVRVAAARAGRGRVAVTTIPFEAGLASDGAWEHLLQPAPQANPWSDGTATTRLNDEVPQVFASTAGSLPSVAVLALFLVAYVVAVGPVTALVLRRRRRELAWLVVPAVTMLFAVTAVVGAAGARPANGAVGRAAVWMDGVGSDVTATVLRAPQAGDHEIALPGPGWTITSLGWDAEARTAATADHTRVELRLGAQEFGGVLARRPLAQGAPLAVEAAVVGGTLQVEVTNVSAVALEHLTVRAGSEDWPLVDHLPAGDTVVEQLALPDVLPVEADPFRGPLAPWDRPFEPTADDDPGRFASLLRWDELAGEPGLVWVTGATDGDLGLAVPTIDGTAADERGTLVAVAVPPTPTDDATSPFEVQRDLLFDRAGQFRRDAPSTLSGAGDVFLRFRLPREGTPTALALTYDRSAVGPNRADPVRPGPPFPDGFECPPDAISCEFNGNEAEVCFPDGHCEGWAWTEPVPAEPLPDQPEPPPDRPALNLQVWDHRDERWVDADDGVSLGTVEEVDRFLGPLGEVWVRATGELAPFDWAGRGVGAEVGA